MTTNFEMLRKDIGIIEDNYNEMQSELGELNAKIVHLKKQGDKLVSAIDTIIEFVGYCPYCWASFGVSHANDCKVKKALAEYRGEK